MRQKLHLTVDVALEPVGDQFIETSQFSNGRGANLGFPPENLLSLVVGWKGELKVNW